MDIYLLQRQPDGCLIDWGRHATVAGVRGQGGARHYSGEHAEILLLLCKYAKPRNG